MDILLTYIASPAVQSLLISYLKVKEPKQPTRFQTLLLNRLVSYLLRDISMTTDFDWKPLLLETPSDLREEKLMEGILWRDQQQQGEGVKEGEFKVYGSVCAEVLLGIASSPVSLDLLLPALLGHLSSLSCDSEEEKRRLGLTLFLRRVIKSTQLTDHHRQLLQRVTHSSPSSSSSEAATVATVAEGRAESRTIMLELLEI
jgi:hypothetical protein